MCTHPGWTLHNSILAIMIMFEIKKKPRKRVVNTENSQHVHCPLDYYTNICRDGPLLYARTSGRRPFGLTKKDT